MLCPTCRTPVHAEGRQYPFCCQDCRDRDLGSWLAERYRIPGPPVDLPTETEEE
ncbi:MAG: DNA gyrase inhibitor YacG [Planctomycetota bacterium]